MKMSTFGPIKAESRDFGSSIEKACQSLGTPPKLAVIYPSINTDIKHVVNSVKSVADVPVIGATTGGAGFTERGIALEGVVGAFLGGDNFSVQVGKIQNLTAGDNTAIVTAAMKNIRHDTSLTGHTIFLLVNAMTCDGEQLVNSIQANVPPIWRIFGGLAGDGLKFDGTKVIFNDEILNSGAVFAYLADRYIPCMGVRHGFCPVDDAVEMKVTDIEGSTLKSIDGRPALEVYKKELLKKGIIQNYNDELSTSLLSSYPIGVKTILGEKWKIRTPMFVQGDSLVLAGSVSNGSRVRVMSGDKSGLISSAKESVTIARRGLKDRTPSAQFVIDCVGRKQLLNEEYANQIKAFRVSSECPLLGFASYGEFARYGGSLEGFHNTTAVTAMW